MRRTTCLWALLSGLLSPTGLTGCSGQQQIFLSRPGVGSAVEAETYYRNINADATFDEWLSKRCFDKETTAYYYNDSDLGLGREMRCARCTSGPNVGLISCAVSNHGIPQGIDLTSKENPRSREQSIKKALGDLESFLATGNPKRGATVAMDYLKGRVDEVRFYIFDAQDPAKLTAPNTVAGGRIPGLQLDNEGVKFIRNCMSCHGGRYDEQKNLVVGGSFLDFDISLFVFGDDPIVTQTQSKAGDKDFTPNRTTHSNNLEPLRALNAFVLDTDPSPAIRDRILGSYSGCDVHTAGCAYTGNYVPRGWKNDSSQVEFYNTSLHRYCATCHFSQRDVFNLQSEKEVNHRSWVFDTAAQFFDSHNQREIHRTGCESLDMPHAEVTRNNLRRDSRAFSLLCVQ